MKDFVPYNEALKLKELGFDEECWCYFINDVFYDSRFLKNYEYLEIMPKHATYTLAPLFSQAFRWFREKYNSKFIISEDYYWVTGIGQIEVNSYEEAELACLQKLIQIVKEKQNNNQ